jgi:hypothetical protein
VVYAKVHSSRAMVALVGLIALFCATLAGCGEPEFTYVKNSGAHTYFKVPHSWHQLAQSEMIDPFSGSDQDSAQRAIENQLVWSVAYDADPEPDGTHIITGTDEPFVYSSVRPLTQGAQGMVSLDLLRNLIIPVTAMSQKPSDTAYQAAAQQGFNVESFELLRNDLLTPGSGIRGVRVVFNYKFPGLLPGAGLLNTFDQTALINDDATKLYVLLIRCSARCYQKRAAELNTVATSFTVRSGL